MVGRNIFLFCIEVFTYGDYRETVCPTGKLIGGGGGGGD